MPNTDPHDTDASGSVVPAHVTSQSSLALSQRPILRSGWLVAVLCSIADWYQYHRQLARERRHLACFDDYMLKDIGLSRADTEREIAKGFWHR
jgi:uncharacterized protein YjiS (DUF1127 family)